MLKFAATGSYVYVYSRMCVCATTNAYNQQNFKKTKCNIHSKNIDEKPLKRENLKRKSEIVESR